MDLILDLNHEELDFIKACARNERWAQRKLYEENYSSLMALCLRYSNTEDDALDILHDGFIKVFKNINKYKPGTSLNAWMKRIMVNTAIDFYRKSVRRRTENLDTAYNISNDAPTVINKMSADEIMRCLQQLTPAYRTVFNLYVIEGYAHKEIAKMLDITESTSRSNLVKARMKLRQILKAKAIVYDK